MENGDLIKEIHEKVGLIQTDIAVIKSDNRTLKESVTKQLDDHEKRLRGGEKKMYTLSGIAGGLSYLLSKYFGH